MLTAIIADDEPLARRKLRDLLAIIPEVQCLAEVGDGLAAIGAIDTLRPDLVFLDIQMPGATGLEVLARVVHRPEVVFTTAFDQYAVTAFEVEALDYLLKPFTKGRLRKAIERIQTRHRDASNPTTLERARTALLAHGPLRRICVHDRGRILPIPVEVIEYIEGCDDYAALHVGGRRHLADVRLAELERRLDPESFVRVHRSAIVNLAFVVSVHPHDQSRLEARMRDGTCVVASRSRSPFLRAQVRNSQLTE
jgi:two-component system LytT family response regulator